MQQIDFYDAQAHQGDSMIPFLGFMVFFAGMILIFIGIVKVNNAKRQWNLFYDTRDAKDLTDPKYAKEKKIGQIMVVVGILMIIGSFVMLPL